MGVVTGDISNQNAQNGVFYLYYNGVVLTGPRLSVDFAANPVMSDDERIVIGTKVRLNVSIFINDDPNHLAGSLYSVANPGDAARYYKDRLAFTANLSDAFAKLMQNGGVLEMRGLGLDFLVNDTTDSDNSFVDLQWGPVVRDFVHRPVGTIGGHVSFVIEFMVSVCSWDAEDANWLGLKLSQVGGSFPQGIVGLSFSVRYDIDSRNGLTSRTIAGRLKIANKRSERTTIPLTVVDSYRTVIQPVVPLGFQRARSQWISAPNKSDLDFSIVDEEMGSGLPYPEGVTEMTLDHEIEVGPLGNSPIIDTSNIVCTLNGSVRALKSVSIGQIWDRVMPMLQSRIDRAAAVNGTGSVLMVRVVMREKILPVPGIDFTIVYMIKPTNAAAQFNNLTSRAGLFANPTATATWQSWRNSMTDAWHNRGIAKLEFTREQDAIINNCLINNGSLADYQAIIPIENGGGTLASRCPSREQSYLYYENNLEVEVDGEVVPWKRYSSEGSTTQEQEKTTADGTTLRTPAVNPVNASDMGAQVTEPQSVIVRIWGSAVRLGFPIEVPNLSKKLRDKFSEKIFPTGRPRITNLPAGNLFGCKRFEGTWQYVFEMPPTIADQFIRDVRHDMTFTDDDPNYVKDGGY